MQVGSFSSKDLRYDADAIIARINKLASHFRYYAYPVIFIQHDGTLNGDFIPNSPEWQILHELDKNMEDMVIAKRLNDCFFSDLEQMLKDNAINELYITGCATDFCVDSTIRSAHTKGFEVHVVKDGHTTADRPGIKAVSVIDHHNWIWQNMIPNTKGIQVSNTSEIIQRLSSRS